MSPKWNMIKSIFFVTRNRIIQSILPVPRAGNVVSMHSIGCPAIALFNSIHDKIQNGFCVCRMCRLPVGEWKFTHCKHECRSQFGAYGIYIKCKCVQFDHQLTRAKVVHSNKSRRANCFRRKCIKSYNSAQNGWALFNSMRVCANLNRRNCKMFAQWL